MINIWPQAERKHLYFVSYKPAAWEVGLWGLFSVRFVSVLPWVTKDA